MTLWLPFMLYSSCKSTTPSLQVSRFDSGGCSSCHQHTVWGHLPPDCRLHGERQRSWKPHYRIAWHLTYFPQSAHYLSIHLLLFWSDWLPNCSLWCLCVQGTLWGCKAQPWTLCACRGILGRTGRTEDGRQRNTEGLRFSLSGLWCLNIALFPAFLPLALVLKGLK